MFNVSPLTAHFGAEISALDLSRGANKSTVAELLRVLDTRGIMVIRGQQLTLEQFMAFSHGLGPLAPQPQRQRQCSHPEYPELTTLSNIVENGAPIGVADSARHWQSDGAHLKTPYRATVQYAVEIPMKDGAPLGDTVFAGTSAAYDALAPALQQQLHGMRALHRGSTGHKKRSTPFYLDSALTQGFHGGVEHPVVRSHPNTGRKCLYVNPACTTHIRGMNDRDSEELLAQLYQHIARAEFIYRHPWQVGDVVLWDNCVTQHRAQNDYELPLRRLLYRAVVKGSAD